MLGQVGSPKSGMLGFMEKYVSVIHPQSTHSSVPSIFTVNLYYVNLLSILTLSVNNKVHTAADSTGTTPDRGQSAMNKLPCYLVSSSLTKVFHTDGLILTSCTSVFFCSKSIQWLAFCLIT